MRQDPLQFIRGVIGNDKLALTPGIVLQLYLGAEFFRQRILQTPDIRIDFIKIDVEGAELNILRGGKRIILQNRPMIVFEHGPGAISQYGASSQDLFDFIVNETGCKLSTMERWLAGKEPYNWAEFFDDISNNGEFYFIAYC